MNKNKPLWMRKSDDVTNEEYASFFHSCVTCMILCENSMEPLTVSKAVLLQHSTSDIMADVLSIAWTELLGEKAIWEFRRRLWVDMRTQWRYELDCTEVSTTYTQYQVWIYWQIDYDMKAWISMRCINKAMREELQEYFMWHCMMVRWYEDKWAWTSSFWERFNLAQVLDSHASSDDSDTSH